MYYDMNNLYGDVSTFAEFQRRCKFWRERDRSGFTGYIFEVDLEYPQQLHDQHWSIFLPTRDKSPGKREDKLLATLYDKQCYVSHYCNL